MAVQVDEGLIDHLIGGGACHFEITSTASKEVMLTGLHDARQRIYEIPHPVEPEDPLPNFVAEPEIRPDGVAVLWVDVKDILETWPALALELVSVVVSALEAAGVGDATVSYPAPEPVPHAPEATQLSISPGLAPLLRELWRSPEGGREIVESLRSRLPHVADDAAEARWARRMLDWYARDVTPAALEVIGMHREADQLRALPDLGTTLASDAVITRLMWVIETVRSYGAWRDARAQRAGDGRMSSDVHLAIEEAIGGRTSSVGGQLRVAFALAHEQQQFSGDDSSVLTRFWQVTWGEAARWEWDQVYGPAVRAASTHRGAPPDRIFAPLGDGWFGESADVLGPVLSGAANPADLAPERVWEALVKPALVGGRFGRFEEAARTAGWGEWFDAFEQQVAARLAARVTDLAARVELASLASALRFLNHDILEVVLFVTRRDRYAEGAVEAEAEASGNDAYNALVCEAHKRTRRLLELIADEGRG